MAVDRPDDMAAIYQQYWELVYRRCLATLGDEEAAEDATQDVFLLALSNFEQVQHDVVRGLLDIARTISYERRRRPAREVSLADPSQHRNGSGDDDPAEIAERHGVLDAVWSGLSPVERRYVADKFAGFSFEEIARRNRRKLGTVSSNLFRAREHARSLRGPTLPALLGVAGWRRLTDLARRTRNAAHSTSTAAAAQPVQTLTLSLTLAGLFAGVTPAVGGASPSRSNTSSPSAVVPPTQLNGGGPRPVAASAPLAASGHGVTYTAATPRPTSGGGAAPALPLTSPASAETPEDTVIYTATPSPNYDNDHTILAIGRGKTCGCSVLLLSTDGGANWTSSTGVPDGDELVLPPAYPADPRIFVGYQKESPGATNWWAPSFASSFQPLPGPAGAIALPAGFDSGDQRVIISSLSGVWSDDLISQVVRPLVIDRSGSGTRAVATPLGAVSTGVFALTSTQAMTPGTIANAVAAPGLALWTCPPNSPCEERATVPVAAPARLSPSPTYAQDQTIAAAALDHAVLSRDDGNTFTALDTPAGTDTIESLTLGRTQAGSVPLWIVVQRGTAYALEFSPTSNGNWHEVDQGITRITAGPGRVVVLGTSSVMYLSNAGGFFCTTDNGVTWSTRCPAA